VGVGRSGEGVLQQWCRFNASISTREVRRRNKALPKDEAEAASSSYSMEKKRDTAQQCGDIRRRRGGTEEGKERIRHQLG
jgi:hypothetical protein